MATAGSVECQMSARKEPRTQTARLSAAIFDLGNAADQIHPVLSEALSRYSGTCYLSHNQTDQTQVRGRNTNQYLFAI